MRCRINEGFFHIGSGFKILVAILEQEHQPMNTSKLAKKINMSYSHMTKVGNELLEKKLVKVDFKDGRSKNYILTSLGKEIATNVKFLKEKTKRLEK